MANKRKSKQLTPSPIEVVNPDSLRELCQQYIDDLEAGDVDSDIKQYIFEAAMEMFFGEAVWDWINSRIE